jgi:hypothetical protein
MRHMPQRFKFHRGIELSLAKTEVDEHSRTQLRFDL